jgi:hypothetical protein
LVYPILEAYFVKGLVTTTLSRKREMLMKKKEVWIIMLILKKLALGKHK